MSRSRLLSRAIDLPLCHQLCGTQYNIIALRITRSNHQSTPPPPCFVFLFTRRDATLQAIVYKLVPGLYEKELLRRRAFYKLRPDEAALATPEQRGEDTEHLIFGPTESISLSLEYSDIE